MISPRAPAWISPTTSRRSPLIIKVAVGVFAFFVLTQLLVGDHRISDFAIPRPQRVPNFIAHGETKCLPQLNQTLIEESVTLHSDCRRNSPFATGRARIATVT